MRFVAIWLDGDGKASFAEQFEHPSFPTALKFVARKMARGMPADIAGCMVDYMDSEFIRKYIAPGTVKRRTFARIESEIACKNLPHLKK